MMAGDPRALAEMLVSGSFHQQSVATALQAMAARGETAGEITVLASAFRRASVPVRTRHHAVLDLCGTGGAPFRTFNVSSIASLVVSSLGVPVAKHGNRSSRGCGSADFFETMGARLALGPEEAGAALDELGFAFLFAPFYHPAMRHVAPVRKQIPTPTVFNMLGPLLNPVEARRRQLIGGVLPAAAGAVPTSAVVDERGASPGGAWSPGDGRGVGARPHRRGAGGLRPHGEVPHRPPEMGLFHPLSEDVGELPPALSAAAARRCSEVGRGRSGTWWC